MFYLNHKINTRLEITIKRKKSNRASSILILRSLKMVYSQNLQLLPTNSLPFKYELIPSIIKWNGFLHEFCLRNFSNFTEAHSKDSWGSFNPMIHFFSCRVHLGNAGGTQPDSHHSVPTATMVNTARYLAMLLVYVILKQMLLNIDYCNCLWKMQYQVAVRGKILKYFLCSKLFYNSFIHNTSLKISICETRF